jgi:DNA invertase Pin-like site-specific DNA recombinase
VTALATVLYVGVFTADPRTDAQRRETEAFCKTRGYSKVRLFVEHESGAKVTRPQLDAMMSEVLAGKGSGIQLGRPSRHWVTGGRRYSS